MKNEFKSKLEVVFGTALMNYSIQKSLAESFKSAARRVIFLDYDGTLIDCDTVPRAAKPDDNLLSLLYSICNKPCTDVVITTGRGIELLRDFFDLNKISLITEHGLHTKRKNNEWQKPRSFRIDWKEQVLPLMQHCVSIMPDTNIENKSFALVWHYRRANEALRNLHLSRLRFELTKIVAESSDLEILEGKNVIEIKSNCYNKGIAAAQFIENGNYDFIAAFGDDLSDEYMFKALPENAVTVRVGSTLTSARYCLKDSAEVRNFLSLLM